MVVRLICLAGLIVLLGSGGRAVAGRAVADGHEVAGQDRAPGAGLDKSARTPAQQKIGSGLLRLIELDAAGSSLDQTAVQRAGVDLDREGRALVDIEADVTDHVLAEIERLGGTVVNRVPAFRSIRARMPLDGLEALAGLSEVAQIRPAMSPITNPVNAPVKQQPKR